MLFSPPNFSEAEVKMMFWFLLMTGLLHVLFFLCELFPWNNPLLLKLLTKRLPTVTSAGHVPERKFHEQQQPIVATIVHNAGIYNGILAAGLFRAAYEGEQAHMLAQSLLAGVLVAGLFGTATLRSPVTALQALMGGLGLILLR